MPCESLATGTPPRLPLYAERLRHAATATRYYSAPALKLLGATLDKLEADLDRQRALKECQQLLNPDGSRSSWQVALEIASGIKRLNRIRPGRLLTEFEEALTTIRKGAKSARRIHDDLTERCQ